MENPNWKNPKHRNSVATGSGFTAKYFDEDGTPSLVTVTKVGSSTYSPPISGAATPTAVPESSSEFYVYQKI